MTNAYLMPGENAARVPARLELGAPLREVWSAESRGLAAGVVPLLAADGLLFTTDRSFRLVALDQVSGRAEWTYPWRGEACLVREGMLYVWVDGGEAHLVDAHSGRPQGCLPCPRPVGALSVGRYLLAQCTHSEHGPGLLACLDPAAGRRLWTHALPQGSVGRPAAFAASADLVLIGQSDGQMVALELGDGAIRWQRSWPEWGFQDREWFRHAECHRIFIVDDRVVASVGTHVVCLGLEDGRTLWEVDGVAQYHYAGRLYAALWSGYEVRSAEDGSLLVKGGLGKGWPRALTSTTLSGAIGLVSDTHAFYGTDRGLVAVERDTGAYVWHTQPKGSASVYGSPVAVSNRLYYRGFDRLFCLVAS